MKKRKKEQHITISTGKCIDLSSSSNIPLMSGIWLSLLEYTLTKMNDQEERRIKRKQKVNKERDVSTNFIIKNLMSIQYIYTILHHVRYRLNHLI